MKTVARLAATAALVTATALAPGLASADEHGQRWERQRDTPGQAWDRGGRHGGWEQARGPRHERIRELRIELRRLDDDRAAFHARNAWRPRKLARYDAWYADQRTVLEQELWRLSRYAWR